MKVCIHFTDEEIGNINKLKSHLGIHHTSDLMRFIVKSMVATVPHEPILPEVHPPSPITGIS
jgi:hypothetical protein